MKNKAGDQSLVRISNQRTIIEYLRKNGPTSKADLSKLLEISKPTVAKNVKALIDLNILYVYGEGKSSGGRRPLLIDFNSNYKYILSLNINIDYPIIALFDLEGKIINKKTLVLKESIDEKEFFEKIYNEIKNIFDHKNIEDEKIGVITVSTPGIIDEDSGEIYANPQFNEWDSINIKKELNNRFNKEVIVKNDVSMSALGEKHYGIGKKYDNLVYISSSLGIGAGIILNGKLYEGKRKAAGEICYFINEKNLSNKNNLEKSFSIPAILKKVQNDLEDNKDSILYNLSNGGKEKITVDMLVKAINIADPYVLKYIEKAASGYGVAINNISILLDLEAVIIGGVLSRLGIRFISKIRSIVQDNNPIDVKILPGGLRDNASIYGGYIIGNEYITKKLVK
ncbi:MAG: ROK family protein [Bacillota bacterium]